MTAEHVVAFLLFALVAAITPGPSNLLLTSTGAAVGILRGLPTLFGVTLGMGLMMFLVTFGLGSLVHDSPILYQALKWGGVAFLLWLAWKIATSGHPDGSANSKRALGFWRAAAFQWVNPKSWLVTASAAGTYLHAPGGNVLIQAASLSALFVLAALPSCFVWLGFGAGVQRLLRTERAARVFNIAMGALLAGSVVLIIWD